MGKRKRHMYYRVPGLLTVGWAHHTRYELDYSEQFLIKDGLDLRPNELELAA